MYTCVALRRISAFVCCCSLAQLHLTSIMSADTTPDYWLLLDDRLPGNGTQVRVVSGNASDDVTAAGNASSHHPTVVAVRAAGPGLGTVLLLCIVCV